MDRDPLVKHDQKLQEQLMDDPNEAILQTSTVCWGSGTIQIILI